MTDRELLQMCRKQFAFLAELSEFPHVTRDGKWLSSRQAIKEEAMGAADICRVHLEAFGADV